MSIFRDENGKRSMSRVSLAAALPYAGALILLDSCGLTRTPEPAYSVLGTVLVGLIAWAGGARGLQHIGGKLGEVARGLSQREGK